jgi:N-ethylmaleimide reductase
MTDGATPVAPSVVSDYWLDSKPSVSTSSGWAKPSPPLDIKEIPGIVEDYRKAAERAKAAGFDGVELHAGNGYLPDQFLQDGSNKRTDAYGGLIENRSRFLLEVVEAMVSAWGGDRVAVRIAPGGTWNSMSDSNPTALFNYLTEQLNRFGLAYFHIIEPRIKGNVLIGEGQPPVATAQLRKIFKGKIIAAGGLNPIPPRRSSNRETRTWLRSGVISLRIQTCRSVSNSGCPSTRTIARLSTLSIFTATRLSVL